jgi:uroporphyrinogen decarboxylase
MSYTKVTRVEAVLRGEHPDRTPFSAWHHFGPEAFHGQPAEDAHLRHIEKLDVDFVKVMNDNEYPREPAGTVIQTVDDLEALHEWTPDAQEFSRQLDLLERLSKRLEGDMLMTTTLFNAWAVLRKLCAPPSDLHGPPVLDRGVDPRDVKITELLREDRAAVAGALETIGRTLASFAHACIEAGADGVFLSVRDDWVDTAENGADTYNEMLRARDVEILEAASAGRLNVVHVCGRPLNFDGFATYPAHVINWADRCAPPSIADVRNTVKMTLSGGLNNLKTLATGTPEACAAEARDALAQAAGRPILVTPGCTYDPEAVPLENLIAARDAIR